MVSVSRDDLEVEFESFNLTLDDQAGRKMIDLCDKYCMSAEDVFNQWMAYSNVKKVTEKLLSLELLSPFEAWIGQSTKNTATSTPKGIKKEPRLTGASLTPSLNRQRPLAEESDADLDIASGYATPQNRDKLAKRLHASPDDDEGTKRLVSETGSPRVARGPKVELFRGDVTTSPFTPSQTYQSRTNKGQIVDSFNCPPSTKWTRDASSSSGLPVAVGVVDVQGCFSDRPPKASAFMMQRPGEIADILDAASSELLETLASLHDVDSLAHLGAAHHVPTVVGGRVCCDGLGRLNAKSLLLEGTRDASAGAVVQLDVANLPAFSLFPGQTVLLQGTNPSGKCFVVSKSFSPLSPESMPLPSLREDLTIFVAAGPFSTADSDAYEPLQDFLSLVREHRPQICVFLGPFLDAKNELVVNNNCQAGDVTFGDLFVKVVDLIKTEMDTHDGACRAIMVPSLRDVHHSFVYPQPPFPFPVDSRLQSFWDPSLLSIGGLLVGITSTDVLFHLGAEEISFPPGNSDRLARLCGHILSQQSFYPLHPPSEDVNMDYALFEQHGFLAKKPHILILPSELKQFIKEVSGCVCLNPGRLAKGKVAGTFCRISVSSDPSNSKPIRSQILRI